MAVEADLIVNTATTIAAIADGARDRSLNGSLWGSWSLSAAGEGLASTARNSYAKMKIAGHQ